MNRESINRYLVAMRARLARFSPLQLAAAAGAVALALGLAMGAGATPSPIAPFSEVLGLGGEHGAAVSEAVHDAKAATEDEDDGEGDGEGEDEEDESTSVGAAVSEAACEAAHDRGTLPPGAQDAPGQQDREPKDCTHPSNADEDDEEGDEEDETLNGEGDEEDEDEFANHGAAVSQAVHDAKENLEEGEKLGPAVSEAACEAAHDRSTLPESAQNAPGQQDREPKDCTHPSNAGDGGEEGEEGDEESSETAGANGGNGHGRDAAPGQQKKQQ